MSKRRLPERRQLRLWRRQIESKRRKNNKSKRRQRKCMPSIITLPMRLQCVTLTTNLAACVCPQIFYQFLPLRSYFVSKRPENFVRIEKFPYAAFGPLFASHCPLFFTRNNHLQCKSSLFAAVDRRSVADKQLNSNGIIHSATVAHCKQLSSKT